jgi:hypothetical protein
MSNAANSRRERALASADRGARLLNQLALGMSVDALAQSERLTRREIEKILRARFDNFPVYAAEDFAKLQILRLEATVARLNADPAANQIHAAAVLLKVFDRLDRYHGFGNGASAPVAPSEEVKRRIMDKLNRIAARSLTQDSHPP